MHDFLDFLTANDVLEPGRAGEIRANARGRNQLLGQILLRRRLVTVKQIMTALGIQALEPHRRLGEIAVAEGYIDEASLDEVLRDQPASRLDPLDLIVQDGTVERELLLHSLISYVKSIATA